MFAFNVVHFFVYFFFDVLSGRRNLFAEVVRFLFCVGSQVLAFDVRPCLSIGFHRICGVLGVSPGLLGRSFDLLRNSGVGEVLIADSFANTSV